MKGALGWRVEVEEGRHAADSDDDRTVCLLLLLYKHPTDQPGSTRPPCKKIFALASLGFAGNVDFTIRSHPSSAQPDTLS